LTFVAIIAVSIGSFVSYRDYFRPHGTGETVSVANRVMWQAYKLPAAASDVTYYTDSGGCEAEFSISESEFLKWCDDKGWIPKKITTSVPYFQPILLTANNAAVTNGYTYKLNDGQGVFDADQRRTAFWLSTFP